MSSESDRGRSLQEIELEVLAEGREWMRQRLEQKLQEEANRRGGVFPPEPPRSSPSAKAHYDSAKRRRAGKS